MGTVAVMPFKYVYKKYKEVAGADHVMRIQVDWKYPGVAWEWNSIFSWLHDYKMSRDVVKVSGFLRDVISEVLGDEMPRLLETMDGENIRIRVWSLGKTFTVRPKDSNDFYERLYVVARDIINNYYTNNDGGPNCNIKMHNDNIIVFNGNIGEIKKIHRADAIAEKLYNMLLSIYAGGTEDLTLLEELLRNGSILVTVYIRGRVYKFRPRTLQELLQFLMIAGALIYVELNDEDVEDIDSVRHMIKNKPLNIEGDELPKKKSNTETYPKSAYGMQDMSMPV